MEVLISLSCRWAWLRGLLFGLLTFAVLGYAADDVALPWHIQAALADATHRTGIDADVLKVVSAERVIWLDGSLGCPEPEVMYTQALVPGYHIRIEAGGETLDYHGGMQGAPLLCPPGRTH